MRSKKIREAPGTQKEELGVAVGAGLAIEYSTFIHQDFDSGLGLAACCLSISEPMPATSPVMLTAGSVRLSVSPSSSRSV